MLGSQLYTCVKGGVRLSKLQMMYRVPTFPGKSWNFCWKISRTWKVLENDLAPWKSWKSTCKVLESPAIC